MSLKELALTTPGQVLALADALIVHAQRYVNDATGSQVGITDIEAREFAAMLYKLRDEMIAQRTLRQDYRRERTRANQAERGLKAAQKYLELREAQR